VKARPPSPAALLPLLALVAGCAAQPVIEPDAPPRRRPAMEFPATAHEVSVHAPDMSAESLVAGLRGAGILARGSSAAVLVRQGRMQILVDPAERGARPDLDRLNQLFGAETRIDVRPLAAPAPPSAAVAFVLNTSPPLEVCDRIRSFMVRAQGTKGLRRIDLAGDLEPEVRVLAEADKLAGASLRLAELVSGIDLVLGRIEPDLLAGDLARALLDERLETSEGERKLDALATIRPRTIAPRGFARYDGRPAVLMLCRAEAGADPNAIRAAVGDLAADLGTLLREFAIQVSPLELIPRGGVVPFVAALVLPPGAGIEQAMKLAGEAEKRLFGLEGLEALAVTLKDRSLLLFGRIGEKELKQLVARLRELPDVHVRFAPFRDLAGAESPLGFGELIRVRGREADAVEAVARQIAEINPGLGPPLPPVQGPPHVVAVTEPERIAGLGLDPAIVREETMLALDGRIFPASSSRARVILRPAGDPEPGKVLTRFTLPAPDGSRVPLAQLSRIVVDVGTPEQAYLGADRVIYFSIEDARKSLDLGPSYPGVAVERIKWRQLGTSERALIAAAALP